MLSTAITSAISNALIRRFKYTPESPHTWAMISDNSFSIVTEENAMSTQPYLMFYEKA